MATVRIKNLRLKTIIGANESERNIRQDIIINVTFTFDDTKAKESDDIKDTCNYRTVTKNIISAVEKSKLCLLEKLAAHILDIVVAEDRVLSAKVEVDKPKALTHADSVSVEIAAERGRIE